MDTQVKKINRSLLFGWFLIVFILFVSYLGEVLKGQRTVPYLITFMIFTALPAIIVLLRYLKAPEDMGLRHYIVVGYFFMYIFVMFTGSTSLVFCYILPMLAFLVLYHDPKLIAFSGVTAIVINVISIILKYSNGEIENILDKEIEIQFAVLFLCFLGSFLATIIYDKIYKSNESYTKELAEQKEELYQQAEELEALNGELNKYSDELLSKNEQMREMTMQTIMTIANTIDAKDEYTRGHSRRVSEYSVAIARELGYPEDELNDIRFIGLLHDIGKIGVPDSVLNKPGRLTNEEYQLMKDHTITGSEILKDITMIKDLDVGARYHHERYDGGGYPEGLKGNEIPKIARIIGVADAYDAMTSNRIYRRHLEADKVLSELKRGNGTQFDPEACTAMLKLIEEGRLPKLNLDDDSNEIKQATQILTRVIDKAEETVLEEVQADELTGTLSRAQGVAMMQEQISKYGTGTLFIFDIDNFRKINEKEGFVAGDMYLRILAAEIRHIAENQIVSRFGSDEFVVYFPEIDSEEEAKSVAKDFIARMKDMASRDKAVDMLSVSIGITQIATEKDRVMVAYENASKALFVAKQYGAGSYFMHTLESDDDDDVAVANSADLKRLVNILLNRDEFDNNYGEFIPEFKDFYDSISGLAAEHQNNVYIVLFTLRATDGENVSPDERESIMNILKNSIVSSIRNIDVTVQYSAVQHILMLVELEENQIRQIINRIMADFYRTNERKHIELHYDAADLSRYSGEEITV